MITTYDYLESENNCFIVKHDNSILDDNVLSLILDTDSNTIKISYYNIANITISDKITLEIYDKFGILQDTKVFDNLSCIEKTDSHIIYKL